MRIINKTMMYVHPESRPQECQLASGLWVPEAGVGIAKGLDVERREGEWWPTNATVVECAAGGIEDGTELTGEDVTECTGGARGLADADLAKDYRSQVDPRLNYGQALELAMRIATVARSA